MSLFSIVRDPRKVLFPARNFSVHESVKKGIEVYANRLESKLSMDINDGVTFASFHEFAVYRKKLKYLLLLRLAYI